MTKRLFKSQQNKMIGGVCGGIAEYFDMDPTVVRVLLVLSIFLGGVGIVLYIAGMILIPVNVHQTDTSAHSSTQVGRVFGWMFIALGLFLLLDNLDIFPIFRWYDRWDIFSWRFVLPVLMISAGLWMFAGRFRRTTTARHTPIDPAVKPRVLRRSMLDRKLLGVCGGIASYFDIDSSIVRILYALLVLGSFGVGILIYFIMAFAMPEEQPSHAQL